MTISDSFPIDFELSFWCFEVSKTLSSIIVVDLFSDRFLLSKVAFELKQLLFAMIRMCFRGFLGDHNFFFQISFLWDTELLREKLRSSVFLLESTILTKKVQI